MSLATTADVLAAQIVLWLAAAWCAFFSVYLVFLLIASLFVKPARCRPRVREVRRILVLIPAHNEEPVVAGAVQSAMAAGATDVELRVLVVADNCDDRTAEVAAEAGADVVSRQDKRRRGKGWALEYGIKRALSTSWCQAIFVMDADSTVSPDTFELLVPRLEEGNECIQARYEISNPGSSWRTRLMAAAFDLRLHVQLLGRRALGLSAGLMGNGMCFSRGLLEKTGWPSRSIVEDLEASAMFVHRGEHLYYEPRARVAADMPTAAWSAGVQRFRWEVGQAVCCVRWVPRLLVAAVGQRRIDPLSQALAMLNPPLGLLVLVICFGWAASALLRGATDDSFAVPTLLWPVLLLTLAVYLIGASYRSGSPDRLRDVAVGAPAYLVWKLWFYVSLPWRGSRTVWVRTPRTATASSPRGEGIPAAGQQPMDHGRQGTHRPRHAAARKYVAVSPVRDEAQYLQQTIDTVAAQTVRPTKWIIVDDGSSDDTIAIAARAASQHDWIELHRRSDRGMRLVGRGVVEAFYDGLSLVELDDYDYLCKLDGDLELPPTYFERLFQEFELNPQLGTASGKSWIVVGGKLVPERSGDDFSHGQTKLYRVDCFREINGFINEVMWDGIDCHRCRMYGWEARSFRDVELRFVHLRPMGSSFKSIFHGRLRWGRGQYFMGTHWLYALATSVYRMFERPFVLGGTCILLGYVSAYVRKLEQYNDTEFRRHLRRWQLSRLKPF